MPELTSTPKPNGHAMITAGEVKEVGEIRTLASTLLDRLAFMRQAGISFKGARDLYEVLGYDRVLTYRLFRARYARGGIAKRIVDAYPKATWRGGVTLFEKEDTKESTPFEKAWGDLERKHQVWSVLQRADILAGLSTYSVLLIGAPGDLSTPLPKGSPNDLLYFSPFSGGGGPGGDRLSRTMAMDADCSIMTFETDTTNPRFGFPTTYQLKRTELSSPMLQRPVHWTRVIHIAEGLLGDNVYGTPTLENVWNLLDDLDKITGGGAEAFWLRANQGMHLDVAKDMQLPMPKPGQPTELEKLKDMSEEYQHGITRWLRTRGVTVTPLGSNVANFQQNVDSILTQIAGSKGIPKRLLLGSEMGQLASGQDKDNWNTQVQDRRTSYAGPSIVRPLVDRLIEYGYLPTPEKYEVEWPVIEELSETEKGQLAGILAGVNKTYGATVFTGDEIREKCFGMESVEEQVTDAWKAELLAKMAMANKTMGVTVVTPAEMRKTCYGWDPLTPDEAVPIGAPEKITVNKPPAESGDPNAVEEDAASVVLPGTPKGAPATPSSTALPTGQDLARTLATLERAIEENDVATIDEIIGIRHARAYASTQVQLPPALAEALLAIGLSIPEGELAGAGREDEPHVTVKYGVEGDSADPVRSLLSGWGPIFLTLGPLDFFSAPEYDVVYASVRSDDLVEMNEAIANQLDTVDTQPSYTPHATIAYVKSGLGETFKNRTDVTGLSCTIDKVTFSPAEGERTVIDLG